jgi:predicted RNA-binding Zn-ribbon protein involved in translation (DUF1610 family)
METQWLEKQEGSIQSFEKVEHTFLNETSGEMFCASCGQFEMTRTNRCRSFTIFMMQIDAFERFTEKHLHGKVIK